MILKPFLYLDLDGTVRYSKSGHEFIQGPDDVAVFPDVRTKLLEYEHRDFLICGITNQGGVAFGYKSNREVQAENEVTNQLTGNFFNFITFCPFHENGTVEPYNRPSFLRKPHIGMLIVTEFHFASQYHVYADHHTSILVGDRDEDKLCAERAGIAFQWADDFFGRKK